MKKSETKIMFDEDIVVEIQEQMKSKNIILMIDVNQDTIVGHFQRKMKDIGMYNVFVTRNHGDLPPTHHRGYKPISTIFHSADLKIARNGILPIGIGIEGDHRNMYVDFDINSFLGQQIYRVADAKAKSLNLQDS